MNMRAAIYLMAITPILFGWTLDCPAQSWRSAANAPAAWVEYANKLRVHAQSVFAQESEIAARVRERVRQIYDLAAVTGGDASQMFSVNIWVNAEGQVERANLAALPNAGMDPDLKQLLSSVSAGPPPPDLLQPVRLQLRLGVKTPSGP
jgi:hypothetical protein